MWINTRFRDLVGQALISVEVAPKELGRDVVRFVTNSNTYRLCIPRVDGDSFLYDMDKGCDMEFPFISSQELVGILDTPIISAELWEESYDEFPNDRYAYLRPIPKNPSSTKKTTFRIETVTSVIEKAVYIKTPSVFTDSLLFLVEKERRKI